MILNLSEIICIFVPESMDFNELSGFLAYFKFFVIFPKSVIFILTNSKIFYVLEMICAFSKISGTSSNRDNCNVEYRLH